VIKELNKSICQLMPQLPLPEIFERYEEMLKVRRRSIALFGEEVGNCVDIHDESVVVSAFSSAMVDCICISNVRLELWYRCPSIIIFRERYEVQATLVGLLICLRRGSESFARYR
jgi:hypothetical protein